MIFPNYRADKRLFIFASLLFAFGLLCTFLHQRFDMRLDDSELQAEFITRGIRVQAEVGYFLGDEAEFHRRLRYVSITDSTKTDRPLIAFIHGAPSSTAFWLGLMSDSTLLERADIIAVDRPGYGSSGYGRPLISVKDQAKLVADLLEDQLRPGQKLIVHGSSYGGTVSSRLAMDYPDMVDGLLLQSASTLRDFEKTFWISYPTSNPILSWLVPGAIHTANLEKLNHAGQLDELDAGPWSNVRAHTVILHGTADWLIYPENAYYSCDRLDHAASLVHHMVPRGQHDFIITQPKLLKTYLNYLLDRVEEGASPVLS
ncbi:MAG: alpha/beta hydrolase [Saprospiraceae bacterium]